MSSFQENSPVALHRTPRRPPVRRREQRPLPPEWHQRAYRAFGMKQKPTLSFRERLSRISLTPRSRRMTAVYWVAAIGMILILMVPLFTPNTPPPQPEPTPAAQTQNPTPPGEKPTWSAPPAMAIDTNKNYRATIE